MIKPFEPTKLQLTINCPFESVESISNIYSFIDGGVRLRDIFDYNKSILFESVTPKFKTGDTVKISLLSDSPILKSINECVEDNKKFQSYKLIADDKVFELVAYQSPRGIRYKDKRPTKIQIEIKEDFDCIELKKHIEYLTELLYSMDYK